MKTLDIIDDGTDKARWLVARRGYVTGTQAAAIAGSHPYYKVIDVWNEHTDPEWDGEVYRNRWLDERAKLGNDREAAIVEWASEALGVKFIANSALVANPAHFAGRACTPDAYAYKGRSKHPIVLDCKTTQQNWHDEGGVGKPIGIPQHVIDQMLWEYEITDAAEVWLAVEQYTWAKGVATLVDSFTLFVPRDPVRLAFLVRKVEEFEEWERENIAPESDIELAGVEVELDDTPEEAADKAALIQARGDLAELAELRAKVAPDLDRIAELEAGVKATAKVYAGRRIHLISPQLTAKLVRGNRVSLDQSKIDPAQIRAARSWAETETVKIETTPGYIAPTEPTERGNA